jgi:hypothetical protein
MRMKADAQYTETPLKPDALNLGTSESIDVAVDGSGAHFCNTSYHNSGAGRRKGWNSPEKTITRYYPVNECRRITNGGRANLSIEQKGVLIQCNRRA